MENHPIETRSITTPVEITVDEASGRSKLSGYSIIFDSMSVPLAHPRVNRFRETITRSAIEKAIASNPDIIAAFDHNPSALLARTSNGTLRLAVDDRGLKMEADLPDTTTARDTMELIRSGLVTGQSFRMLVTDDHWERRNGEVFREVRSCQILEVGPVVSPAYPQTSITAEQRSAIDNILEDEATANPSDENPKEKEQAEDLLTLARATQAQVEAEG